MPGFNRSYSIKVDLRQLSGVLIQGGGTNGRFWPLELDMCVRFCGTKLEVFPEWREKVRLLMS